MTVPSRVHIAPVGYEKERVYNAANELNADKVVLIGHTPDFESNDYPDGREYFDTIVENLEELGIDHKSDHCNIFDLYESLGTISEIITTHRDDDVYVNVATGSKITAIAGMIASMVTGATAYYVRGDYDDDSGHQSPPKVKYITDLPQYPIQEPDSDQINILNFLQAKKEEGEKVTKGHLINFSEYQGLSYINKDASDKAQYRLLDVHILEPLLDQNYIIIKKEGRNKVIEITEKGWEMLRAFGYLVDTDPETSETQ